MPIRDFDTHTPHIDQTAYVDPQAIIIGQVSLGQNSSVWPTAVLRGDMLAISIGNQTNIQDGCIGHTTHASRFNPQGHALTLGDQITVGHQVVLHGCTIYDKCLIGMQSLILDGAVIESEVILGAGSLVSPGKTLESGYLYLGRPAVKKRALTEEEKDFIQYSADNYAKLSQHYGNS